MILKFKYNVQTDIIRLMDGNSQFAYYRRSVYYENSAIIHRVCLAMNSYIILRFAYLQKELKLSVAVILKSISTQRNMCRKMPIVWCEMYTNYVVLPNVTRSLTLIICDTLCARYACIPHTSIKRCALNLCVRPSGDDNKTLKMINNFCDMTSSPASSVVVSVCTRG